MMRNYGVNNGVYLQNIRYKSQSGVVVRLLSLRVTE